MTTGIDRGITSYDLVEKDDYKIDDEEGKHLGEHDESIGVDVIGATEDEGCTIVKNPHF